MLHEFGHLVTILVFKQKINTITITAIGGLIDCEISTTKSKEFLIFFSGVFVNLIIHIMMVHSNHSILLSSKELSCIRLFNNLMLTINILPIYPLDGFKMLDCMLVISNKERLTTNIGMIVSNICLFMLFIYGFYERSIGIIIIGIFLFYKNYQYYLSIDNVVLKKMVRNYMNI